MKDRSHHERWDELANAKADGKKGSNFIPTEALNLTLKKKKQQQNVNSTFSPLFLRTAKSRVFFGY